MTMPRMMKASFRSESQAGGASREECVNAGVLSFRRHPSSSDAGLGHPLASLIRVRLLSTKTGFPLPPSVSLPMESTL